MGRETFDVIAKGSQFADHFARTHLLRLFADGRSPFFVAQALVQDLPDQSTQALERSLIDGQQVA
jgi:hypothetical protein